MSMQLIASLTEQAKALEVKAAGLYTRAIDEFNYLLSETNDAVLAFYVIKEKGFYKIVAMDMSDSSTEALIGVHEYKTFTIEDINPLSYCRDEIVKRIRGATGLTEVTDES